MRTNALALLTTLAVGGSLLAGTGPAVAAHGGLTVTGLTADERLVTFKANDPGTVLSSVRVTGVEGDLQSVDFRPATRGLYGVSVAPDGGRLYLIDPATGVASRVGSTVLGLAGNVSIDVNPVVDRLRVVSDDGTNLRVNPDTGALAATDGRLAYVAGDAQEGTTPRVGGVAYSNNDNKPETSTTLYDLDAVVGQLARQDPPNAGGLQSVGALPQPTKAQATGFDVYTRESGVNWAFVSLVDKGRSTFYEIDLATGAAKTFAANPADPASGTVIGGRPFVTDIALLPAQGV